MEQIIVEVLKALFARTDPVLVAVLLVLAVMQYRTNKKVDGHLDPKNRHPHPECEWGEKSYNALAEALQQQHDENRQDHQTIFDLLRNVPVPEERFRKMGDKK
jgi:hypothetical protein